MEVRVADVRKEFARFPALHNVSLDIRSGELIALLGPSGSGKTTLLRLIAGLERPTEGTIFFGEEDASQKSVQERNVGFVFQHYALFRHMTVADNIGFGLKVRPGSTRPATSEIRRRALELLDLVQLQGLEKRYPAQLSGGQRQRVALARAMAIEPKVLLLDEPFGALDALVRKELRRWLREIHDKTGHTTVFVTHDQDEALELADRVVVMSQGRIEQLGTPDEIMKNPNSLTGKYLTGEKFVPIPERRPPNHRRTLKVVNARGNNLKNVSAEIPLGLFTCVTGVSGGGKSTLLIDTLYKSIARKLNGAADAPAEAWDAARIVYEGASRQHGERDLSAYLQRAYPDFGALVASGEFAALALELLLPLHRAIPAASKSRNANKTTGETA